jgi:hypothetical protein
VSIETEPRPDSRGPRRGTLAGIVRDAVVGMSPRERWGWVVSALGMLVILAGVLHLTSATIGGRVHEFKDRRTYNEVKTAAHAAFPLTLLLGLAGLGIVWLGGRMRASARRAARERLDSTNQSG